jgi:hypothetical protein
VHHSQSMTSANLNKIIAASLSKMIVVVAVAIIAIVVSLSHVVSQNQAVAATTATVVVPQKRCNLRFGCVVHAATRRILTC